MMENDPQDYTRIIVLDSDIEAQFVASILEERAIPHFLRSYHDTAYDGLFQVQKGWGEILAPTAYKAEIEEIVTEVRLSPPDPDTEAEL